MRQLALAALVILLLSGSNTQIAAHGASGVIKGRVTLGPTTPLCREDVPCEGIYAGAKIVVRTKSGEVCARSTSDQNGEFRIDVSPGRYIVAVDLQGKLPRCSRREVTIAAGQATQVTLDCDTGMR